MAELICEHCNRVREVAVRYTHSRSDDKADYIRGVLTCTECEGKTVFGMRDNVINFYPTSGAYGKPSDKVSERVKAMFQDAELCFFGAGFRGAVAMSRACIEQALEEQGFASGVLEDRIEAAEKAGTLGRGEYMMAHGSRLVGNAALHKEQNIDPGLIPPVLAATIAVVNKVAS